MELDHLSSVLQKHTLFSIRPWASVTLLLKCLSLHSTLLSSSSPDISEMSVVLKVSCLPFPSISLMLSFTFITAVITSLWKTLDSLPHLLLEYPTHIPALFPIRTILSSSRNLHFNTCK